MAAEDSERRCLKRTWSGCSASETYDLVPGPPSKVARIFGEPQVNLKFDTSESLAIAILATLVKIDSRDF